jgi:hypothetical protein
MKLLGCNKPSYRDLFADAAFRKLKRNVVNLIKDDVSEVCRQICRKICYTLLISHLLINRNID